MLTDKERRELLEKHLEAKARNSLRLADRDWETSFSYRSSSMS